MAELLQIHKDRAPTRYALPQGVVTIGSSPSNRIHLSSPAVADRHAKIVVIGQRCVIENITHDAGTLIDDAEVDRHELSDAELIQIGQYHFQFRADESAGIVPTPRVKALLEARRNDIMRQPIPRTPAAATIPAVRRRRGWPVMRIALRADPR